MKHLQALTTEQFIGIAKSENELGIIDYEAFFATQIQEAKNFAIGPYYWFIGDNAKLGITVASENIGALSPFSKEEWENQTAHFFVENIHVDDSFYVLSALQLALEKIMKLPTERQADVHLTIYARMLNAENAYRWVMIQMPGLYVNNENRTTCALMMVTDLTHFSFEHWPVLMILTDRVNNKNEYFEIVVSEDIKLVNVSMPHITKRELEIVKLMTKGLNSPKIADLLSISYHTVENHKRNLRVKTGTKTSAELIHFMMKNCLL